MRKTHIEFVMYLTIRSKNSLSAGFTLVELLIVIVVVGILASITVSGMTNQINKARKVEAIVNVNACQKEQKSYYAEKLEFAPTLDALALPAETNRFIYKTEIFTPDTSRGESVILACCMAAEKANNGQMVFACVANN